MVIKPIAILTPGDHDINPAHKMITDVSLFIELAIEDKSLAFHPSAF